MDWTQVVGDQRPNMVCTITMPWARRLQINVSGMTDTGLNVTIISVSIWPPSWSTTPVWSAITGLGGITHSCLSRKRVLVKNPEGQTATIWPYITAVQLNLWRRDIVSEWGVQVGRDF